MIQFPEILPHPDKWRNALYLEALNRCDGHQTRAAKLLGVSRQTFNKHVIRHSLKLKVHCYNCDKLSLKKETQLYALNIQGAVYEKHRICKKCLKKLKKGKK